VEPYQRLTAIAVPLDDTNIDTGRIFPSRFLRKPRSAGYHNFLFRDARFDEVGNERPDFIMNRAPYRAARRYGCEFCVRIVARAGGLCFRRCGVPLHHRPQLRRDFFQ